MRSGHRWRTERDRVPELIEQEVGRHESRGSIQIHSFIQKCLTWPEASVLLPVCGFVLFVLCGRGPQPLGSNDLIH